MNLRLLAPEIFLSLAAMGLLVGDVVRQEARRLWIALSGLAVIAAAFLVCASCRESGTVLGMMVVDGMGRYFKLVLLAGVLLVLWMSSDYRGFDRKDVPWGTYCALLLLSAVGLLLLVSANDFLLVLVALELISITSFILTGFMKEERRSSEAAIKFFLVGAFSSGLMIYGISLLYGILGTTSVDAFHKADWAALPRLPLIGAVLFVLAGLGFKMAMVPFHMWVPDAYEGAPTPITAYLSVAPKAAAFGALIRVFGNHQALNISFLLAILAAATMSLGNFSALRQTNVKRLLAYSSIAQMGYVLVGFVAAGSLGTASVLLYTAAYLFMNLGAFACVIAVTNDSQTDEIDGFSGLSERSFPLALATTLFLLSLTGIPPLIGFVGKFSIFAAAVQEGWMWLAVVAVVNSVVSVYYYFSLVHRMFFKSPLRAGRVSWPPLLTGCVTVALLITLVAGVFPNPWLLWIQGALR